MLKVAILLSYYNGHNYIDEQLSSISKLDTHNMTVDVILRNDGSFDKKNIAQLEYIKEKYSFLTINSGGNVGVVCSFYQLLCENPGYDYYAFCDQDDYWCRDKLKFAISSLLNRKVPALYCSDYTAVDADLRALNVDNRKIIPSFHNSIFKNYCTGCTCVINNELRSIILERWPKNKSEKIIMHDWWLLLSAYCVGDVVFDNRSFILYRQHGGNVIGAGDHGFFANSKRFLKNVLAGNADRRGMIEVLLSAYEDLIPVDDYNFISLCIKRNKNIQDSLSIIFTKNFTYASVLEKLAVKFLILTNRF